MSIKKATLASLILLSLTACGGGGSGGGNSVAQDQKSIQQVEAEKVKAEKSKIGTDAAVSQEKKEVASTTTSAEKSKTDVEAAVSQEKKDTDSTKVSTENTETEAAGSSEEVTVGQETSEAEQVAEEKARQEKLAAFKAIAMEAQLSEDEAHMLAVNNLNQDTESFKQAIEKFKVEKGISNGVYPVGTITNENRQSSVRNIDSYSSGERNHEMVYTQPYSVVTATYSGLVAYNNQTGEIFKDFRDASIQVKGSKTGENAIPKEGSATYSGKAFNGALSGKGNVIEGNATYNVNFENRTGSGKITGLGDDVTLAQGEISGTGITSSASQNHRSGQYTLDFYGPEAQEIGGKVTFDGKDTIGFGGTRGDITK